MAEIFPRHRRNILMDLQMLYRVCPDSAQRRTMAKFIFMLASEEFHSFLLPVNGQFVKDTTPTTLKVADWRLPFPKLILEYSMSEAGFPNEVPSENCQHSATIIIVEQVPGTHMLGLHFLWRRTADKRTFWCPGGSVILLEEPTQIEIEESGWIRITGIKCVPVEDKALYSAEQKKIILRNYLEELKVLAHFALICKAKNITAQKVLSPAPASAQRSGTGGGLDEYYALKCTGPTHFDWLPTSGMLSG